MQKKTSATIYDVANRVGVSLATVSRVVNGNTNVRESTKRKVLAAIDELGYQPNAVARGLASKKTTTIGVVLPDVTNLFYSELARGIDDIANMYHYDVLLTNTDDDPIREVMAVNNLVAKQVDGIIFMGSNLDSEVMKAFDRIDVPVVLAGSLDEDGKLPSVNIDYKNAVYEAISKLLTRHEKVALVISEGKRAIDLQNRVSGYKQAVEERGFKFDEKFILTSRGEYESGIEVGEKLHDLGVTAVLSYDDQVAVGILNYMHDHNINVPEDFEIITSDDTKFAEIVRPDLSSIKQPKYDIGAVSMRMLTKLMNSETLDIVQMKLPHSFKYRGSTNN